MFCFGRIIHINNDLSLYNLSEKKAKYDDFLYYRFSGFFLLFFFFHLSNLLNCYLQIISNCLFI